MSAVPAPPVVTVSHRPLPIRNYRRLPITDEAALRIFRDCFGEYLALLEETPVDLTLPQVAHFLIDFDRTVQRAIGPMCANALARFRAGEVSLRNRAMIGRHLVAVGLWPVEVYFART